MQFSWATVFPSRVTVASGTEYPTAHLVTQRFPIGLGDYLSPVRAGGDNLRLVLVHAVPVLIKYNSTDKT